MRRTTTTLLTLTVAILAAGTAVAGGILPSLNSIFKSREKASKARLMQQLEEQQQEAPALDSLNAPPVPEPSVVDYRRQAGKPVPLGRLARPADRGMVTPPVPQAIPVFIPYERLDASVSASSFVLVPAEALARLLLPADEKPAQIQPPVDVVAATATYTLTVDATAARLDATLTLDVLRRGYVVLPLPLGADAALEHVTLDGSPVETGDAGSAGFTDRTVLPLVLTGAGRRTLSFRAHLPVTRRDGEMGVAFSVIPSPIAALVADVPGRNLHMDVAPGAVVGQAPGAEGRTTIRCQLTPGPRVSLRWYEETAAAALTRELPAVGDSTPRPATPPRRPPVVTAVTFTGLTVEDGRLDVQARIHYQIDHAPVDAFDVALPPEVELLSVTGPDGRPLKTWRRTPDGLEIFLSSQRQGEVAFELRGHLSLLPRIRTDEGGTRRLSLALPFAAPRRCASSSVFLGLRLARTLSPAFPDAGAFTNVTEQDLPSWIPAAERTGLHAVYKALRETPEAGPVVDLEEERVSFPDSFRIVDAAVDTVVTTERESQTKVTYRVVNSRRQFLQVRLPEGSSFQSLFVDGAPAKAGRSGANQTELLIPLVKSSAANGAELRPFNVELVYTTPVAPFGVAGRLHLEALWTGATADRLRWRLGFPGQLTFSRSDGSLEQRESSSSDWNILPATTSSRSGVLRSQALGGARRDWAPTSNVMNAIREPAPKASNRTEGAYPVRLDLPVADGTAWFAAENVSPEGGELPWLDVFYVRGRDLDTVRGVIIILVGFSLLLTLLRLLGRQSVTLAAGILGLSLLAGLVLGLVIEGGDGCVVGGLGLGLAMAMVYGAFTPIRRRIQAGALVLMILVVLTGVAAAAQPVPPLEERTVRVVVPYPKDGLTKAMERYDAGGFVASAALDEAARPTPVPTPVPKHPETVSLESVTLDAVSDGEGRATLRLTARVTTVGSGWHTVPLLQAWAALTDVTLDGKPAPVLSVDDATVRDNERRQSTLILAALQGSSERIERTATPVRFAVPVLGEGRHTLEARLILDVDDRGNGWRGFTVNLPEFTERVLSLKLPIPGARVDVAAARKLTVGTSSEGAGTQARAVLSGRSQVSARWLRPEGARRPVPAPPAPEAGSSPAPAPVAPAASEGPVDPAATPVVVARLGLIASLDETHLKGSVVVDYRIERQGIEAVRLQIPAGVTIKTVHGSTHKDYQVLPHRDGIHQVLAILLRRKTTGSVTTGFDFEMPLPPAGDDPSAGRLVVVPAVRSLDTDIETGVLGVERTGNLELDRVGEPTGLEKLEPTEIPESYRPLLMGRAWLVYRYRRQPWALTLSVREHPVDVGFTATVDEAVATTSLNRKGRGTTDVRLEVRNYGASFLNVELAPGVGDFKALTIDGRNENFLKLTKDRMIRIPLRKPTADRDYATKPMKIAFRFDHDAVQAADGQPLAQTMELPGRRVALFFPRMNLPVTGRGLAWTVQVAPRLHIATFSGRFDEPRRPMDSIFDLFRPERGTSLALGRAFVPGSPEGFDEAGRAALSLVLRVRSRGTNMALHTLAGLLAIIAGSLTLLIVMAAGRPWFRPAWPVSALLTFLGLMTLELSSPGQQGPVIGGALASPLVALVWYVAIQLRRDRPVPEGGGATPAPDRTAPKGGDQR